MSMSKGSVTIDPDTGAASGSGCAKAIFDVLDSKQDYQSLTGEQLADAKQLVADLCESIAEVVDYVINNAEVEITISTSTGGLQTSAAQGDPSDPPASQKTLPGTVT
jgi:hypothetical protein